MKRLIYLLIALAFITTSCTSSKVMIQNEKEVAGYTLKNKKELMQQKISNNRSKTVLATP
ncbi:MAG: hypothetical protein HKN48_09290 [Flavobacteriaceae bacterium]|nr:hypothetical protein [Flavobacteriaceae bacterium]